MVLAGVIAPSQATVSPNQQPANCFPAPGPGSTRCERRNAPSSAVSSRKHLIDWDRFDCQQRPWRYDNCSSPQERESVPFAMFCRHQSCASASRRWEFPCRAKKLRLFRQRLAWSFYYYFAHIFDLFRSIASRFPVRPPARIFRRQPCIADFQVCCIAGFQAFGSAHRP